MYIMDLAFFGFKVNLEVLILIGIVYLVLVVNTLTSCCNVSGITEGFAGGGVIGGTDNVVKDVASQVAGGMNLLNNAMR
jgi:hypothetical protein